MTERNPHKGLEGTVSSNAGMIDKDQSSMPGWVKSSIYRATLFVGGMALGCAMALPSENTGYDHAQILVLTGFTSLFMFPLLDKAFINLSGREIAERALYVGPGVATGLYFIQTLKQF